MIPTAKVVRTVAVGPVWGSSTGRAVVGVGDTGVEGVVTGGVATGGVTTGTVTVTTAVSQPCCALSLLILTPV